MIDLCGPDRRRLRPIQPVDALSAKGHLSTSRRCGRRGRGRLPGASSGAKAVPRFIGGCAGPSPRRRRCARGGCSSGRRGSATEPAVRSDGVPGRRRADRRPDARSLSAQARQSPGVPGATGRSSRGTVDFCALGQGGTDSRTGAQLCCQAIPRFPRYSMGWRAVQTLAVRVDEQGCVDASCRSTIALPRLP